MSRGPPCHLITFRSFALLFLLLLLSLCQRSARAATPAVETAVLDALYESTDGDDSWDNKWDTETTPPCYRYGVTCDPADHITGITLANNNLIGPLPPNLGDLTYLKVLELQDNWIQEGIPESIVNLVELETLDLSHNAIVGGLNTYNNDGPWLPKLVKLKYLKLGWNQLEGILPINIGDLVDLEVLELASNDFFSILPWTLKNCAKLEILDVRDNNFVEPLLEFVQDTTAPIREIRFSNNQVYDTIPDWLAPKLAETLEILELDNMMLHGNIPDNFGLLTQLTELRLENNYLEGTIPASLASIAGLNDFRVSNNCLGGVINPDFCDIERDVFDVGSNLWVCPIPACLLEAPQVACQENATAIREKCVAFFAESSSSIGDRSLSSDSLASSNSESSGTGAISSEGSSSLSSSLLSSDSEESLTSSGDTNEQSGSRFVLVILAMMVVLVEKILLVM